MNDNSSDVVGYVARNVVEGYLFVSAGSLHSSVTCQVLLCCNYRLRRSQAYPPPIPLPEQGLVFLNYLLFLYFHSILLQSFEKF